jgi:tRNA(fMet)-specific endonuclease VapC
MRGDNSDEDKFWLSFFSKVKILDLDYDSAVVAGKLYLGLKAKGNLIDIQDMLIAAIAISKDLKLATGNKKHISRIKELNVLDN